MCIGLVQRATRTIAVALCTLLAACATPEPQAPRPEFLFHDALFADPSERASPEHVFALNPAMKHFLGTEIAVQLRTQGVQAGLIEALHRKGQLRLEYDASTTRNAAEAFDARAGNCLSLVLMTAAFAKELGLHVRFQSAYLEEMWSRSGDLLLRSGHVNVTLGPRIDNRNSSLAQSLTVDFLPASQLHGLRTREISEQTVIAMYMNNRAVEALVRGQLDDAYAWAREAVRHSPDFLAAQNTLGIVYLRHGNLPQAAVVFNHVIERDPVHTRALSNLAEVYTRQGRESAANDLYRTLARIEPEPPFHYFNLGLAAMQRNEFAAARDLFAREVALAEYSAELHFHLSVANYRLGDVRQATKHLNLALENSNSPGDRDLYSAKLVWLRSQGTK